MNKSTPVLFLTLIWAGSLLAQVQNDVNKILAAKDFVAFKQYADSLANKENRIEAYWEQLRDVTRDHQEGIFYFKKATPTSDNPAIGTVRTFGVQLIATERDIIYYQFAEIKNKKVEDRWVPYFEIIGQYKNDSSYLIFNNAFKAIFQVDIDSADLFSADLVYGEICGFAGTTPEGRQQIDEFVKNKDKASLIAWLQSPNTEKQVYAIDGLYQLKKAGITYTREELRMIMFVKDKKGTMYVCRGCRYARELIKRITDEFRF